MSAIARLVAASEAVPMVLGPLDDTRAVLHAYAMEPDEMTAIFVDGDWHYDGEGETDMESLFGELAGQVPEDKIVCAIVIKGSLSAPMAVLSDRDTDWAPSLIVGGNVIARAMCLGGGGTHIVGDLSLDGTLYGKYNHGSLEIGGSTAAALILSDDFDMHFQGEVHCQHILSSNGSLNIAPHFEDEDLARVLQPDFIDDDFNLLDDLVMDAVFENRSLLLAASQIGKTQAPTVSRAGREALARLEAQAATGWVRHVDLRRCDLKFVPEVIARYTEATSLNLEGNRIGTLPDALAALQQLEVLTIDDCRLTVLPDWVAQLPRLRILNAQGNDFTAFPALPGGFPALEVLQVGNTFTDSEEHEAWVCNLQLAQFPALRSFTSNLNVSSAFSYQSEDRAWESSTLAHLRVTAAIDGEMPACLSRMAQLRCLDLQLGEGVASSALAVFATLTQLEALQLSYGDQDTAFNAALAARLPRTLIRLNNTRTPGSAIAKSKTALDKPVYERNWEAALPVADHQIALVEAAWPAISADTHEHALNQKLRCLTGIAIDTPIGELKRERIQAAAGYAAELMQRYAHVSTATMWQLSFSLGHLRADCLITEAWWLLRRAEAEPQAAAAILDALDQEFADNPNARHVAAQFEGEITALRALIP